MSESPFQELIQCFFETHQQINDSQTELQTITAKIREKYEPRAEFERWRDSVDGKAWKQERFRIQKGLCSICKEAIQLKGSHIDHKRPISLNPELAVELRNLQITCPDCNTSKGNRIRHGEEGDRQNSSI